MSSSNVIGINILVRRGIGTGFHIAIRINIIEAYFSIITVIGLLEVNTRIIIRKSTPNRRKLCPQLNQACCKNS